MNNKNNIFIIITHYDHFFTLQDSIFSVVNFKNGVLNKKKCRIPINQPKITVTSYPNNPINVKDKLSDSFK